MWKTIWLGVAIAICFSGYAFAQSKPQQAVMASIAQSTAAAAECPSMELNHNIARKLLDAHDLGGDDPRVISYITTGIKFFRAKFQAKSGKDLIKYCYSALEAYGDNGVLFPGLLLIKPVEQKSRP